MPMVRTVLIIITFFLSSLCFAAGVYVKNSGHYTELIFAGLGGDIVSVSRGEDRVVIEFTTPLSADLGGSLKDPFIKSMGIDGKMVTINFFEEIDYSLESKGGDVKVVAAKSKKTDEIKLGYGIEKPLIKGNAKILEDGEAETALGQIDEAIASDDLENALYFTENFLQSVDEGYYRQEALFRLAMIYFKMGDSDDNNYVFASQLFDDFVKSYPDSFRKKDALVKSAESKELANLYNEAIFAYQNVIKGLRSRELKKKAYERIAEIYSNMGQVKKAIEAHEEVIKNFKETFPEQKAKIGMLQAKKKDYDLAYSTFLTIHNSVDFTKLGSEELYTMGMVFEKKDKFEIAKNAYEKVYQLYPSSKEADMAMYKSALMFEKLKKEKQTDARLDICRKIYKEKDGGLLCGVMYARRHMDKKMPAAWEEFLKVALESRNFDIRSEAELVIINSLVSEGSFDEAEEKTKAFIRRNFTSERLPEVYRIRQRITLTKARKAFKNSDYATAKSLVEEMLVEYPDTEFRREATEILQDISFGDIKDKYEAGMYKETVDELSDFLVNNKDLINPEKWMFMLQEAKYAYAKEVHESGNYDNSIISAGEYLASFPNGIHSGEVKEMLQFALSSVMDRFYKNREYIKIISLYDQNSEFINTGGDEPFRDKLRSYTAFSLYRLGMPEKSSEMLDRSESGDNPYYLMTSVMLGRIKSVNPDIFSNEMVEFLVQELEADRSDELIDMLKRYNNDKKFSTRKIYEVSKGIFEDIKREKILFDLYDMVEKSEDRRFDGYAEIYLDAGMAYYKKNNFENGVKALEQFKLTYTPRNEKRAEGLYYLGKSYMKLEKNEEAINAYMELLESIPSSVYASAARSELEEIEWRKNLKK